MTKRLKFVLVDHENVRETDLRPLVRDDVHLIVFLGSEQKSVPTDLAIAVQACGSRGEYIRIHGNGHNALDFHIAFTIGERVGKGEDAAFNIISKDKGFDPLISYLKSRKIVAARYASIGDLPFLQELGASSLAQCANQVIERLSAPKATKPRKITTLENYIRTASGKELAAEETAKVIATLRSKKFISVTGDSVKYPGLDAPAVPAAT